jgi:predicted ATPase
VKRYILTGAPGSGKTSIVQVLRGRGYAVVDEAATDVIAAEQSRGHDEPWNDPVFVDRIIELQRSRQRQPPPAGTREQVYDRSPVCTLTLARYLGHPVTATLSAELHRIIRDAVYERRVFFIRTIGFCLPTSARRISYEDSLEFERCHVDEYERLGFELVQVPADENEKRAAAIGACLRTWAI